MSTATTKNSKPKNATPKNVKRVLTGPVADRTHKKCSVCGKLQPMELYYRPAKDCRCKECSSKYAKQLRERKAAEAAAKAKNAAKNTKAKNAAK